MQNHEKPSVKPNRPYFSSGPCAKPPTWSLDKLQGAVLGRSHRSKIGKERIKQVIDTSHEIMNLPDDYRVGIVTGSDTAAFEMAMWSLLGPKPVDIMAFESFGQVWLGDIVKELKLKQINQLTAPFGEVPDVKSYNPNHDLIFTWNGTTGGTVIPENGDWIADDRVGLTLCDATSAVLGYDMNWQKLDVITWSWQKIMGGEAGHGMIALSPRAVQRLESYDPPWPMPKLFRLKKKGKINEGIFKGETINTPSMLCVEDALFSLNWVKEIGGAKSMIQRAQTSYNHIEEFVETHDWIAFLAKDKATRSSTSVCLTFSDTCPLKDDERAAFAKKMVALLEDEAIAYDIGSYRDAPSGFRIWCGGTVEPDDVKALMPWLDWAYHQSLS